MEVAMPTMKYARLIVVMLGLFLVGAYGQAGKTGKKEFTFKGKVEKVDEKAKVLTVANENVPGYWQLVPACTSPIRAALRRRVGYRIAARRCSSMTADTA